LKNGCDSRYLVLEFVAEWSGDPLDFYVIGADQGFKTRGAGGIESQTQLVMGPGERFDVIINFSSYESTRVFLKNSGGDEPFGGLPAGKTSRPTSFVMAFDVGDCVDESQQENEFHIEEFNEWVVNNGHAPIPGNVARTRHVALFEGADEFGRLQPLLGTAEPATDHRGNPILWPIHTAYMSADLSGQVEGTVAWHTHPSTENPRKNDVEIWKIWNLSMDGHPIHLHLVDFEVLSRHEILFAINADDDNLCPEDSAEDPIGGVCLEPQPVVQHNGEIGNGFRIRYPEFCTTPNDCYSPEVVEHPYTDIGYPKDIVIANPGEVTVIKAKFDKTGHFVWHCHVLSHEDHEMMRVLYVGDEGA
jgi:FtsP/CotA-like multicopper oxidase with cupredoxin domain